MMEFPLEEWEWPPGMERVYSIEPFEADCPWQDGLRKTVICAIPFYKDASNNTVHSVFLFQRQRSTGKARNYVAGPYLDFRANVTPRERRYFLEYADSALESYRIFHFPGAVAMLRGKTGQWANFQNKHARFRLPFECSRYSGKYLFHWLQEQLDDENSEVSYAYHWLAQTENYHLARLQEFVPSLRELILRASQAALLCPALNKDFIWHPALDGDVMSIDIDGYHSLYFPPPLEEPLKHLRQLFKRWFPPAPPDSEKTPLCVCHAYWLCYKVGPPILVEGASASHHNRLEARVSLREWLRGKATLEDIEKLLSPET